MIKFSRYPHLHDLLDHYIDRLERKDISEILRSGINTQEEAETFAKFIWDVVGQMNEDEDKGVEVLGHTDNSEMIPDISYEITRLMRDSGFYSIWVTVSDEVG
ncbi:MAG: hypothetical protein ACR2PX_08695 [Endozoicomonas sp.]|uniref:hypothetical protein n=1 Tax=Endozoicomonas sp. TaxID=1892382 RepID=UPI003D9B584F